MGARIAVLPGSFDPITVGHVDIAKRALKLFDRLLVVVADNQFKTYLFTWEERVRLCRETFKGEKRITVLRGEGLTAEFAKEHKASVLVRGLRSSLDFEFEKKMADVNKFVAPGVDTVFLLADPRYSFVSSSSVKAMWENGVDIAGLVPPAVLEALKAKANKKPSA